MPPNLVCKRHGCAGLGGNYCVVPAADGRGVAAVVHVSVSNHDQAQHPRAAAGSLQFLEELHPSGPEAGIDQDKTLPGLTR